METLDQLVKQRVTKLEAIRSAGTDPYQTAFQRDGTVQELLARFQEEKEFKAAGRLTALRTHGKSTFADIGFKKGENFNQTNGAVGIKVNVAGKLLADFNLLFKLNDAGLRDKLTPLFGLEFSH